MIFWFTSHPSLNKAVTRLHQKTLHGLDGSWGLDEMLLKQFASQSSGTLLREAWEAKLIGQKSKEKALTDSTEFLKEEGFKWAAPSIKGEIETAHRFVARLVNEEPIAEEGTYTDWCTTVLKSLETEFLIPEYIKKGAGAPANPETQTGRAAIEACYQKFTEEKPPTALSELVPFSVWRHLLADTEKQQVVSWRESLMQGSKKHLAAAPAVAPKPSKTRKQNSTAADIESAAKALFA
eukprot:1868974-Amphidinium_carterae.2